MNDSHRAWITSRGPANPAVRLRAGGHAGRSSNPFTTGILIGIGETPAERVDPIFKLRRIAGAYGGIQGHRPELPR